VVDASTRLTYISPSCLDLLGYEPAELIGTGSWPHRPECK